MPPSYPLTLAACKYVLFLFSLMTGKCPYPPVEPLTVPAAGRPSDRGRSPAARTGIGGAGTCSLITSGQRSNACRTQVGKQRREILDLQRAGIPSASAEILLQRMLDKIDGLCAERDKLKADQKHLMKGKALGGRQW
jgi:hypothetical protein